MEQRPVEEQDIESLVRRICALIEQAEPEKRDEMRQAAASLLQGEMSRMEQEEQSTASKTKRPLNPLALGILLLVLGGGLSVLLPPIGLVLIGAGLMGLVWSAFSKLFAH